MTIEEYLEFMMQWKKEYETVVDKKAKLQELQAKMPEFETLYWAIFEDMKGREGYDKLKSFIQKSDFMKAPASTKYHNDFEGGLLIHSLNVYCCLYEKRKSPIWRDKLSRLDDNSLALITLCHDFHKLYFYITDYKNQKIYSEQGSKSDSKGKYDWETVPYYTVDDKYPLGVGERSVIFLMQLLPMKMHEIMAVRWHHGFAVPKDEFKMFEDAIKKFPEALALHQADCEASELLEAIV